MLPAKKIFTVLSSIFGRADNGVCISSFVKQVLQIEGKKISKTSREKKLRRGGNILRGYNNVVFGVEAVGVRVPIRKEDVRVLESSVWCIMFCLSQCLCN